MKAKRIQVFAASPGAANQTSVQLFAPLVPREEINFHNIWASFCAEPLVADANAQGSWALIVRRENTAQGVYSDAAINSEEFNAIIIACGVWCASNQNPHNKMIQIKTSRNLNAGDALDLIVHVQGVTSGTVLIRMMLCAHTSRK